MASSEVHDLDRGKGMTEAFYNVTAHDPELALCYNLSQRFRALPNRLILLMEPFENKKAGLFLPDRWVDPKFANVHGERYARGRIGRVVSAGSRNYCFGDRILVKDWEGMDVDHGEPGIECASCIPKGRSLKFLRSADGYDSLTDMAPLRLLEDMPVDPP